MRTLDLIRFTKGAATGNLMRTALLVLAVSIGVGAVVVLTALGDGARRYVVDEFSSLGTNLVIVLPGRSETGGFNPGNAVTSTPRDLTVNDAKALYRAAGVRHVTPLVIGTSEISYGGRLREVMVAGTTAEFVEVRRLSLAQGRFLSAGDWNATSGEAVIGEKIREELFGNANALGERIRVGDRRFRVIGVMAPAGQGLGQNTDELIIVPVSTALAMFNTNTLFRVMIEASNREGIDLVKNRIGKIIQERHEGEEDVTIITQDAVLATFDKLLGTLTLAVAGIAAISLAVAGILVMNVMLVSVTQRTAEIGLLKALGATGRTIRILFLAEAALLSSIGALTGFFLGHAGAFLIRLLYPVYPAYPPAWAVWAGLITAMLTGLLFGVLPANRAARLDPVASLAKR